MFRPRLEWLLALVPAAIILEIAHGAPVAVFVVSGLAILPLAGPIGHATEDLAGRTGPQIGGLLNATFGNVTELITSSYCGASWRSSRPRSRGRSSAMCCSCSALRFSSGDGAG